MTKRVYWKYYYEKKEKGKEFYLKKLLNVKKKYRIFKFKKILY